MKKFGIIAASVALTVASVVPALADVQSTSTTTSKAPEATIKTMPAKSNANIRATVKKSGVKKVTRKPVTKKKKAPVKATPAMPASSATSSVR